MVDGDRIETVADLEIDHFTMLVHGHPRRTAPPQLDPGAAQDKWPVGVVLEFSFRIDPTADGDVARWPVREIAGLRDRNERGRGEQPANPEAWPEAAQDRVPKGDRDDAKDDQDQGRHGGDDTRRTWKGPKEPPRHVGVDAIAAVSGVRPLRAGADSTGRAGRRSTAFIHETWAIGAIYPQVVHIASDDVSRSVAPMPDRAR